MKKHQERKHSKFSASGAERWINCPGSVELCEGVPDVETEWSKEGTLAHELLEEILIVGRDLKVRKIGHINTEKKYSPEMKRITLQAANFILEKNWQLRPHAELLIERRVFLDFIHPEAFGTLDASIVDLFGTLHVLDYKYGSGHSVSVKENLQMIFYALAVAHEYQWCFSKVCIWIVQPRIRGYNGPVFWEISIAELKKYVALFEQAIERVIKSPTKYAEGSWCHWCKAKSKCPLKQDAKAKNAKKLFTRSPV
jgi:hypothetical protein